MENSGFRAAPAALILHRLQERQWLNIYTLKLCKDIIALYVAEQSKLHLITPFAGFLPANWMHDVSVPAYACPQQELSDWFQKRLSVYLEHKGEQDPCVPSP